MEQSKLNGKTVKLIYDDTEFLFCQICGQDYAADPNDIGTYVCPCGRKNKNIDAALAKVGVVVIKREE